MRYERCCLLCFWLRLSGSEMISSKEIIPFGKFKNYELGDVPAWYLLWLAEQEWVTHQYPWIVHYVEENRKAIEREHESQEVDIYD